MRNFEYYDKEDIVKKIVSLTFGRFLSYYADAPEIEKPASGARSKEQGAKSKEQGTRGRKTGPRKPEKGYQRLFVNLGKADGFYPGEVMQFINKNVGGRVQVGHIDLLDKISYIEVPTDQAEAVKRGLDGASYKRRTVRCNDADSREQGARSKDQRVGGRNAKAAKRRAMFEDERPARQTKFKKDDWMKFLNPDRIDLKGDEPDFSEDGWARRRPKKE